ncbi:M6 family metalloprotease domain-containing protein [bacterium]|nr:M6 family metalloprotease domain-containing protein [bacterium]
MNLRTFLFSTILLSLVLLTKPGLAMPPHPELRDRIRSGEIEEPYFLRYRGELTEQGVNRPAGTRTLYELLGRSLDENMNILAILVDFSDNGSRVQADFFDGLLFDTTRGSLRDYYREVSYGNLTLTTVNLPGALGWQRAPQTYAYYVNRQNGFGSYPRNAQRLAEDAVHLVDPLVDFSQYDNDDDGYVDALFIIHAGPGAERTGNSNHIWSHMWRMRPQNMDGVTTEIYSMEPEFWNTAGDMTCGVYAHEMGHSVFGLPDFYDYDYDSEGLGKWSLMAGGSWNGQLGASPAHPDAWGRIQMGFVQPVIVSNDVAVATIPCVETSPVIYRLWTNGTGGQQYFLAENRQRRGYDAAIPGDGLLIYHVDDREHGNDNQWYPGHTTQGNYQVALEQADGEWNLERNMNTGDPSDPFPGTTGRTRFTRLTTPDSRDYNQQDTRVGVRRISASGDTMTASLLVGSNLNVVFAYVPDTSAIAGATLCVPVAVEDELASFGVTRVQCRIQFDPDIVVPSPPYYSRAGGIVPAGWSVTENHGTPGAVTVTAQGGAPLSGSGPLFCLVFAVPPNAVEGVVSPLRFTEMVFNQGSPAADTTGGSLTVTAPHIEFTPEAVDFGYIRVSRPAMNGLVIRNSGTAPLIVDSAQSGGVFSHDLSDPVTLLPNEWTPVRLRITPTALGEYRDTLLVYSNAGVLPRAVPVRAVGALPFLHTHPSRLTFDSTGVGEFTSLVLTVMDTGYYALRIENMAVLVGEAFTVNPDYWPRTIPGRDSLVVAVHFQPTGLGLFRDTLVIAHDAGEDVRIPVEGTGSPSAIDDDAAMNVPHEYYLSPNYPNPFNPLTTIRFGLPVSSNVSLRVFDISGREVAVLLDGFFPVGHHRIVWDAAGQPSGLYFLVLRSANFTSYRKAVLLK